MNQLHLRPGALALATASSCRRRRRRCYLRSLRTRQQQGPTKHAYTRLHSSHMSSRRITEPKNRCSGVGDDSRPAPSGRFRTRRIKPRVQDFNLVTKYRCERAAPVRPPAASERCPNGSTHAPQTPCVSARSENVTCAGRQASRHPACGCRNARARTNLASHLSCDARWVRSVAQHAALSRQRGSAHTSCACRSFTALPSSVPSEPQV